MQVIQLSTVSTIVGTYQSTNYRGRQNSGPSTTNRHNSSQVCHGGWMHKIYKVNNALICTTCHDCFFCIFILHIKIEIRSLQSHSLVLVKVKVLYLYWITLSATWVALPRGPVKATPHGSIVTTGGNRSTRRKPAMFGRVKLDNILSHMWPR